MPRRNTAVKTKSATKSRTSVRTWTSPGAIDLHFHGALGIDLMIASAAEMDELARRLWENGIVGFCPTTLSVDPQTLEGAVRRIGSWIESRKRPPRTGSPGLARPLGIHLEGPFISPAACGAHPPDSIRPVDLSELERLWTASQGNLRILTVAPEAVGTQLEELRRFCRARKIILSLGHSRATEEQAKEAFQNGFTGVTHAWNALAFHQREPGALGAALGRKGVHVEVILDQVHVAPTVVRWTRALHGAGHGAGPLCFVSDCVPPAIGSRVPDADPGEWARFGPLMARFERGACRLEGGHLAGGGRLLTHAYCDWLLEEAGRVGKKPNALFRETIAHLTTDPLRAIGEKRFRPQRVRWTLGSGRLAISH